MTEPTSEERERLARSLAQIPKKLRTSITAAQRGGITLRRERSPGQARSVVTALVFRSRTGANALADAIHQYVPREGRFELELNGEKFWVERQGAGTAGVPAVVRRG
jgi:hypothetical protein